MNGNKRLIVFGVCFLLVLGFFLVRNMRSHVLQGSNFIQASTYTQGTGFALMLGWQFSNHLTALLMGREVAYGNWSLSGDISSNKVAQISYGVGLNYRFF